MMRDENGQEDHQPVYLPENRHHWASNDEVTKPVVNVLRGPVRGRFKKKTKIKPGMSVGEWMAQKLPRIGAGAIAVIAVLYVMVALYTDLVRFF